MQRNFHRKISIFFFILNSVQSTFTVGDVFMKIQRILSKLVKCKKKCQTILQNTMHMQILKFTSTENDQILQHTIKNTVNTLEKNKIKC